MSDKNIAKQDPVDLFNAQTTWFHLFRSMFESGDVANMGPTAFTVYACIKAHASFKTGEAFPGLEALARLTGLSERQIRRALRDLETMGYLSTERDGRRNRYTIREKINFADQHGRPAGTASWDYAPLAVEATRAELKNFLCTGETATAGTIHIERVVIEQLNVQVGGQGNIQVGRLDDPALQERFEKALAARGAETVDKS